MHSTLLGHEDGLSIACQEHKPVVTSGRLHKSPENGYRSDLEVRGQPGFLMD